MPNIEEIEAQIQKRSREDFAELREWFLEQDWKAWDAQNVADAKSGKLDRHAWRVQQDHWMTNISSRRVRIKFPVRRSFLVINSRRKKWQSTHNLGRN